jgi:hypothetical protein
VLELAERASSARDLLPALDRAAAEFRLRLEDALAKGEASDNFAPAAAGFAVWAAANAILGNIPLVDAASELDDDPDGWDASFHGSVAWSGAATWEPDPGDADRRREYWTWWLREPVSQALA